MPAHAPGAPDPDASAGPGVLDLVASVLVTGSGDRVWQVPDGWQQGRGCWGGLVVGALVRAALDHVGPEAESLRLRHLSAHLLAPVPPGPARVVAEVLRRGSATTTVQARLVGVEAGADGGPSPERGTDTVLAQAVLVLGRTRDVGSADGPAWRHLEPPASLAAGWRDLAAPVVGPPLAPVFAPHLQFRPIAGIPTQGDPAGRVEGWIAARGPLLAPTATAERRLTAADVEVYLAMIVDAWWPPVLVQLDAMRPVATIGSVLDLPGELPPADLVDAAGAAVPLAFRARPVAARGGYATESRELWTESGTLVALNTQTMVVIR